MRANTSNVFQEMRCGFLPGAKQGHSTAYRETEKGLSKCSFWMRKRNISRQCRSEVSRRRNSSSPATGRFPAGCCCNDRCDNTALSADILRLYPVNRMVETLVSVIYRKSAGQRLNLLPVGQAWPAKFVHLLRITRVCGQA